MTVIPSCPWCRCVTNVERLPRLVRDHQWLCQGCNVTFAGTVEEYRACAGQRELVKSIKSSRQATPSQGALNMEPEGSS